MGDFIERLATAYKLEPGWWNAAVSSTISLFTAFGLDWSAAQVAAVTTFCVMGLAGIARIYTVPLQRHINRVEEVKQETKQGIQADYKTDPSGTIEMLKNGKK